ncbi:hypothetical protein [Nocardia rhizosphaerae]|uniref:Homeodomain-like domain-containing protein n=1 Tax=Nocardia rhizosphaerae TaxID=1691571 RepID=A0ABV8LDG5_9NOCA
MSAPRSTVPVIGDYKAHKLWRMRQDRGEPSTMVDAKPAQDHAIWLHSIGFNDSSIAAAAGLTPPTVNNFRRRAYRTARAEQAARLLAVSHIPTCPEHDTRYVPALGARRRIQALLVLGWTYTDIGAVAGIAVEQVSRTARGTRTEGQTWQRIDLAYETLSGKRGPSSIGAKKATNRGYASPMAWEGIDIDHPDSIPLLDAEPANELDEVLLQRMIDGRHAGEVRGAERKALIDHAIAKGWDHERLARSLNVSPDGAGQALVRRRRELRREAA